MNMKQVNVKFLMVTVMVVGLMVSSCSSLNQAASSISTNSQAYLSGKGFGTSLASLYTAYKSAGKLDLNNANNLLNLATLATNAAAIKGNLKNTAFYKDFAAGAVGSTAMITNSNVNTLINTVAGLDLNSLVSNTKNNVNNATTTSTTNALISVLNTLAK